MYVYMIHISSTIIIIMLHYIIRSGLWPARPRLDGGTRVWPPASPATPRPGLRR